MSRTAAVEAGEDGARNDAVADVELDDFRDRGHRRHVVVGEPMAGVHFEPEIRGALGSRGQALQLARLRGARRFGVGAGVQFDDRRAASAWPLRSARDPAR